MAVFCWYSMPQFSHCTVSISSIGGRFIGRRWEECFTDCLYDHLLSLPHIRVLVVHSTSFFATGHRFLVGEIRAFLGKS